ncbi:MAG: DUF5662 family protein [Candidatus Enteromonas sp.]|nr:DUF5662 family protein [Candidatus Enteromonas sp.]
MSRFFSHIRLVLAHRHRVIANASHCGIFWHSLFHDLSKFSPQELFPSAHFYVGDHSPVYEQRLRSGYFSSICQHHTKRNKHHWEYWTDFFAGRIIVRSMPWKYAMEYVCDVLSASYCYHPESFRRETPLEYFRHFLPAYHMTKRTSTFIEWCLDRYRELGFAGLKKKDTRKKYEEIASSTPEVEVEEELHPFSALPETKPDI